MVAYKGFCTWPSVLLCASLGLCSTLTSAFFTPTSTYKTSYRQQGVVSMSAAPAVIVGKGRIGLALKDMLPSAILVGRDDAIPSGLDAPIYVCTRNDDLRAVIDKTPAAQRSNLVFLQNGMLDPLLKEYGLQDSATQALVYFAVAKKGEPPTDGKTDLNPEGLTAANGKWAQSLATTLQKGGLSCHVLDKAPFRAAMMEKLIWICAFMVVGASHGGITVGEVESVHKDEVVSLIRELKGACESKLGTTFQDGVEARLCAYTRSVAHFPTAVKELPWRNGFFWDLSQSSLKAGQADPCPTHSMLLKKVGAV